MGRLESICLAWDQIGWGVWAASPPLPGSCWRCPVYQKVFGDQTSLLYSLGQKRVVSHAFMLPNADNWFSLISRWKAGQGLHRHKTREVHLDAAKEVKIFKCLFILSLNKSILPKWESALASKTGLRSRPARGWHSALQISTTPLQGLTGKSLATWEHKVVRLIVAGWQK